MKQDDFIGVSSYLRVLEKKWISSATFLRATEASTMAEAMRIFSQNSFYDFSVVDHGQAYEDLLSQRRKTLYEMAYGLTPHREVVEVLACRYDFHNAKVALKDHYHKGRMAPAYAAITDVSPKKIEAAILLLDGVAHKSDVPLHLFRAMQKGNEAFLQSYDPQEIDIVLDGAMFSYQLCLCEKMDNDFITAHIKLSIDLHNVKAMLRVKEMQKNTGFFKACLVEGGNVESAVLVAHFAKLPTALAAVFFAKPFGNAMKQGLEQYEQNGSFAALERLFDDLLITQCQSLKYTPYGAEVLFAHLICSENELRNLRIVLTGKRNGIAPPLLKERLRECYA